MRRRLLGWLAAGALALGAGGAGAQEREQLEALRNTTLNLIRLMVSEGLLSQEKANTLIQQAEAAARPPGEPDKPVVRVPYVPQVVREQIKEQLREEVMAQARAEHWAAPGALPSWVGRITWEGDVRLRYQHDRLDRNNAPAAFFQAFGQNINNTTDDRDRLRLRARVGLRARVFDELEAGVRFGTGSVGSTGSPNSANNTLGDSLNRQSAGIDLAYLRWDPAQWLRLTGGRFQNPFLGSDMVWAPDLNFDGAAATLRPRLSPNVTPFLTLGAFPLKESEPTQVNTTVRNKWLYAAQAGVDWGDPDYHLLRVGLAYYDYRNVEGIPNADPLQPGQFDWTAPQFRQKGNSMFPINLAGGATLFALASKFRQLNLTAEMGLRYDEFRRFTLLGDWVRNTGFDRNEILNRTGGLALEPRRDAWQARIEFGHRRMEGPGDWSVFGGYRSVQRDALLDAFNDGDFNLGGTNAKGWFAGGSYAIGRNAWFSLKYTTANQIDGPPLAIDTLHVDFNARF